MATCWSAVNINHIVLRIKSKTLNMLYRCSTLESFLLLLRGYFCVDLYHHRCAGSKIQTKIKTFKLKNIYTKVFLLSHHTFINACIYCSNLYEKKNTKFEGITHQAELAWIYSWLCAHRSLPIVLWTTHNSKELKESKHMQSKYHTFDFVSPL